jgi:hypothetical protein
MPLSDTQLLILSAASQRTDHAATLPPNLKGSAAKKVIDRLLKQKLLQELRENTTHTVVVLDDGFALDGRTYKSLSAVAKVITGTNWNGYAFFGINRAARGNKAAAGSKRDPRPYEPTGLGGGCSRAVPELNRKGFACVIQSQNRSPSNARFTPANHRKKDWSRTSIRYMRSGSPARHI